MRLTSLVCILAILGCSTTLKDYTEEYETIKGTIAAPPVIEDGGDRLIIYLQTGNIVAEKSEIVVAVAENEEEKKVLKLISDKILGAPNEVMFLYGAKVEGPWQEYIEGIDFQIIAIGVYNPNANSYDVILASYGTRTMDALRNVGWGGFIKILSQAALKRVI